MVRFVPQQPVDTFKASVRTKTSRHFIKSNVCTAHATAVKRIISIYIFNAKTQFKISVNHYKINFLLIFFAP